MANQSFSPRIGAVVASRFSSSRLPGKAMLHFNGDCLLGFLLSRLKSSCLLSDIVVATSERPEDDLIVNVASKHGLLVYRGGLDDVLDRYVQAAKFHDLDIIVRLTGDNPFVTGELVDFYLSQLPENLDRLYTTRPNCPKGLNVEILPASLLERLNFSDGVSKLDREHVTSWFYAAENKHKPAKLDLPASHQGVYDTFSIDTLNDYKRAMVVMAELYDPIAASTDQIINAYKKIGNEIV